MHETRYHEHNSFITLTYDEKNLPPDQSLIKSDWQLFMKRLRKWNGKFNGPKLKYLHCGEYGQEFKRPHYHACVFGLHVPDKKLFKENPNGDPVYSSNILDLIWGKGFTTVGNVTWKSAAYVARYSLKKINGKQQYKPDKVTGLYPYERCHLHTGQVVEVIPEYATMSRNPGLGKRYIEAYMDDVYPWDEVIVNGHPTRPPRYYDNHFEHAEPEQMEAIRERRIQVMQEHADNNTRARLSAREKVKIAQTNKLTREIQ